MRKISLSIVCSALVCSSVALANNPAENATDLKGMKPFVGFMVGTLTETASESNSSSGSLNVTLSATLFQTGLWGGLEFNFMDNLGVRVYANILSTPLPSSTSVSPKLSGLWTFSGNIDLIYRPTQNIGIFVGIGLGDIMGIYSSTVQGQKVSSVSNSFATMWNSGVQYNINANNILELSAILTTEFVIVTNPHLNTVEVTTSPTFNIAAKYAYRF